MKSKQDIDEVRNGLVKKLYAPDISIEKICKASQAITADNTPAAPQASVEGFVSIKEVCKFIGISRVTVWRLCVEKRLKGYTVGRRKLFRLSEVAQAIKSGVWA